MSPFPRNLPIRVQSASLTKTMLTAIARPADAEGTPVISEQQPKRIDSHHHFWDPAVRDYPWMKGLTALERPFGPDDLRPLLAANGIDSTVLVQAHPSLDETHEMLQTAGATDFVAGVVGWADLTDLMVPNVLQEVQAGEHGGYLKGIRPMLHDEEDENWILGDTVQTNLHALADAGIVLDLLVTPRELPGAIITVRDFPHVRFVVDHIAKPPIAAGEIESWAAMMHEFADLENAACKLSGMVNEADPDGWSVDDLVPYVSTVYEIFGPDRLMYGSDWPVCTLAAPYDAVYTAAHDALERLGVLDGVTEAAVFGNTAIHWYGLEV